MEECVASARKKADCFGKECLHKKAQVQEPEDDESVEDRAHLPI